MNKMLFVFCIFLLLSGTSFAQFYSGPDLSFMTLQHSTYMSNVNLINSNSDYYASQRRHEKNKRSSKGSNEYDAPANPKSFLFVPNAQTSAKIKQSIIDNNKKKNPSSTLDVALSDRNNPYPGYVRLLKALGLDIEHNYADAFTAYILGMWRIANKMATNPSAQEIRYVRNQVLSVTDVSGWTDRKKQESTEYLIYDLIFANEPYESSRQTGNRRQLQADSDIVQQRFLRENKLDLRNMDITENGLTRKK